MTKKPDMLSAFTRAARSAAPAPAATPTVGGPAGTAADQAAAGRRPSRPAAAAARRREEEAAAARKNLVYRTSRANWLRIRQLALADDISVQDLFHQALCHEFESRGLRPLDD